MLRRSALLLVSTLLWCACDRGAETSEPRDPEPEPKTKQGTTSEPPPKSGSGSTRTPGALPLEYPPVPTRAKKGEFVLAPSKGWIEEAFEKGADSQPFIFYGAWMVEPGPAESTIKTLPGQTVSMPNAMIIPIGGGEKAKPGDIVLTAWSSGSGMQRAIVVEGGTPTEPKVRYLDLDLDSPSGWGKKEDSLKDKTFHVLTKSGEPGSTLACKDGARTTRWIVVGEHRDQILGVGFAGKLKVLTRSACKQVPIVPRLRAGDTVYVPVIGAFTQAKVSKIDEKIGRVWVKHEFGGKDTDQAIGFTEVLPSL
jgi:hypothetical protein